MARRKNSRHGSYPGDISKIPKTKAAFQREYYNLLTEYFSTRQYIGAGKYEKPTAKSLRIADRLAELQDAHPDWAFETDDKWSDDQRLNPRRKNANLSASHGLSKAEEKRVRAQIQQDLVAAFMRALDEYAPSTIDKNKIGWGSQLLDAYKSSPNAVGFYAVKERYFGGHSASAKARKWLNNVNDSRWDTIIRAAAKEAIARHKSGPRRRKNSNHDLKRVQFWRDYEYDSKNHKYVRTWFARRDGETPTYKVSKSALEEYFGSVRGLDGTSTVLSRAEWGNLRPRRGRPANAPSETGHIYNPRRRKNIMSSATESYGYDSYCPRSRKGLNPYAKRYTLNSFSEKYWGEDYHEVPRKIRMEFWDDFKYAFKGGLGRYKLETRG